MITPLDEILMKPLMVVVESERRDSFPPNADIHPKLSISPPPARAEDFKKERLLIENVDSIYMVNLGILTQSSRHEFFSAYLKDS